VPRDNISIVEGHMRTEALSRLGQCRDAGAVNPSSLVTKMGVTTVVPFRKLQPRGQMRVLLVHNPKSGDDNHGRDQLIELITRAGHDVTYHKAKRSWQSALDSEPDLVVAAGGDGTVSEVVRAIGGRKMLVTALPLGTANNIAGWLGIADVPVDQLVRNWDDGDVQPFDVGVADGPWGRRTFLESVGVGLLTDTMAEIDSGVAGYVNRLDGRDARVDAALAVLEQRLDDPPVVACRMQLDDQDVSGDYLLVEIMNFGTAGPNLRLSPNAHAADGVLDIVTIAATQTSSLKAHLSSLRSGPGHLPFVGVTRAQRVTIDCEGCQFHLDDELWPDGRGTAHVRGHLETRHAAVKFLVPRPMSRRLQS
jgi:diacylglycerol kinase (ATP)